MSRRRAQLSRSKRCRPAVTQGACGPWTITSGTGTYTALRGKGTATIDSSTGENTSPIIFSDSWSGAVDFDATAPTGSFTAIKLAHPRTSRGRWHVTVFFSARDNVDANPVSFSATATAGSLLREQERNNHQPHRLLRARIPTTSRATRSSLRPPSPRNSCPPQKRCDRLDGGRRIPT